LTGFDEAVSYTFDYGPNSIDHYNKISHVVLYRADENNPTEEDKAFIGRKFILTSSN
jgi:hypothetical protein